MKFAKDNFKVSAHPNCKLTAPEIEWNGDQGNFYFENKVDPAISINPNSGIIEWTDQMTIGIHTLKIKAKNKAGSIIVTVTLTKSPPPVSPPSEFVYPQTTKTILIHESGTTQPPKISWNGEKGTFSIEGKHDERVSIDPITGIIRWEANLLPGQYKLAIVSSNNAGKTSTEFTLIVNGPNVKKGDRYKLYQNYPNPASDITHFVYHLTREGIIDIIVTSTNGRLIKTIISKKRLTGGRHSFLLNVEGLSKGIYFMQLYSNAEGLKTVRFVVE